MIGSFVKGVVLTTTLLLVLVYCARVGSDQNQIQNRTETVDETVPKP